MGRCLIYTPSIFQDKVRDEIKEVLGDDDLQIDHLSELKYTEMVIKETLRLYPIAPMMVRQTTGDIDLGNEKFIIYNFILM